MHSSKLRLHPEHLRVQKIISTGERHLQQRDSECAGYPLAYCDGVCQCTYNALNAGSTCIATAPQQSTACPPGQTYIPEAGACMTGQYPGEPCQYSLQCSAIEPGAFCLRLRCECMYGMVRSGNGCTFVSDECHERGFVFIPELGECRQAKEADEKKNAAFGQGCSTIRTAYRWYQKFRNGDESLEEHEGRGRHSDVDEDKLRDVVEEDPHKAVQAGDPCVYTAQCHASQSGMVCERNVCRCPTGMVSSGSKCTQSCPTGYMVNSKGVCTPGCQSNQIEVNGECLSQSVPGQDCRVNAQCTGGSSCLNYQCTCPRGMFPRGGACEFVSAAPLSSCRDGERCTRDAICVDGACVCPAGRQIVNGQCLTSITVPPMSPCGSFVSCGGGSSCIEGICQCPQNLQSVNGSCQYRSSVAPGSPCPTGLERCLSQATCVNGVCQCPFGMVAQGNDCVALRAVPAGSTCNRTSRCRGLAVCVDGICHSPADLPLSNGQCRAGTVNINGVCVEQNTAAPGSSCASGQTCSGGSNCMNSICVCPAGQVNIEEQCRLVTNILGSCDVNMKCVGGAVCDVTRRLCVCPARSVVVRGSCVDITNVARMSRKLRTDSSPECIADSDCPRLKSCVKGRCMIGIYGNSPPQGELQKSSSRGLAEFFQGRQSPTSVKKEQQFKKHRHAKPGESCSRYEECTGDTHCNPLTLTCDCNRETQMVVGSRCVERLRSHPGLPCSNGEICVGTSVCLHGTCSCPAGFVIVNRECVVIRRARPSEECGNGEECEGGSVCDQVRKRCICREGQRLVNDRCEDYVVLPGGSCSSIHARCSGGSHCFEGRCVCPQATYISGGLCIPRRAVGPGNYCGNNDCYQDRLVLLESSAMAVQCATAYLRHVDVSLAFNNTTLNVYGWLKQDREVQVRV
ncbi:unnamed protein product [Heligmosomoides polygyrus]|uniref:EB module n=1 Tax=Heligmosomoides polygyrus TaxID=6339 RepID=A0A3P7XTE0_HELPZ|nr:unnamed protein product [Heligmosomoides polygyrus]